MQIASGTYQSFQNRMEFWKTMYHHLPQNYMYTHETTMDIYT